jgi:uncharacterized YigZ family protein
MMPFSFLTLAGPAEGLYKEKGSKFMAFAFPVVSESDIREKIAQLKKDYFDARHHGYAWILGADGSRYRAFDDGEPNHSTGDPILGQIRSRKLTNVLVVVVRYFGGTKLGVSGLVSAYRAAADDALTKAAIIECEVKETFQLRYDFSATPEVMRLIKEFDLAIRDQLFESGVTMTLEFGIRHKTALMERLTLLKALGHKLTFSEPSFV